MASYVVLLRGVNVGGLTIRMADLRRRLTEGGFAGARTVLASGNVLVETGLPAAEVGSQVQQILRESYGYDAWVQVLTPTILRYLAEHYPFPADDPERQPYVVFCRNQAVLEDLWAALPPTDATLEQVALGPSCLYWLVAKGHSVKSPVAKILARGRYKADTTTRNLRTVHRLLG
ncbi:MAG TPA: DUF1697 domain-containing protein [Ruania sp.]|nr:DUF1697 domain-containing protein [Ruania sp.]